MERPALKTLMQDVGSGLVDVIIVYKIDRLTRSLADFAKMVEVFDAKGVSFVSVTQQFNTTTSMGRLTLSVLLSFAQFEREVTAERISRLPPIAFLAPDIVEAIMAGRQPPELTARHLKRIDNLPLDWDHQRKILGFPAVANRHNCPPRS